MSDENDTQCTLFIGGSHDGERITVEGEYVRIPPNLPVSATGMHDYSETFEPETYQLTSLSGNSTTFDVYLLSGMSADDLINRLIDGYQTNLQS